MDVLLEVGVVIASPNAGVTIDDASKIYRNYSLVKSGDEIRRQASVTGYRTAARARRETARASTRRGRQEAGAGAGGRR
jgi:hypothetical protein